MSDTILTDKTLESKSQEDEDNENENKNVHENLNENKNENVNENDETLMSSGKDDDYYDENENDDETMSQNKITKETNDLLDEIIDKSKSFQKQIKLLEKREDLKGYWPYDYFGDKELKFKYFKIEPAGMLKITDKKLFETIFGYTLEVSASKLINTTNKKENQIIVENTDKNKDKLYKECETSYGYHYVIQSSDRRIDLKDAIDLILEFN